MSDLPSSKQSDHSCDSGMLTAKYLMKHTTKKDLTYRLQNILQILQHDECIEADSSEYPGLAGLCLSLTKFVDHQDKQVRMIAVSSCMELFTIYAPDAPWDKTDTLKIFRQTIRQLANLAHTTSPKQSNFHLYLRILELLAEIKIAVLLVELHKDGNEVEALNVLAELFRTILHSIRTHHPYEVFELTQKTISACLEEYGEGVLIPTALLDELLICIGQGPIVLVTNPSKAAEVAKQRKSGKRMKALPPHQVEQDNPSYIVASAIIRKTVDRLSTPIANLLNGLLNADPRVIARSSILITVPGESRLNHPKQQDQSAVANVWNIVYEFHRIAPSILTTVIGTLVNYLTSPELEQRTMVVRLLGRLFCRDDAKLAVQFRSCFREWLKRSNDVDEKIRSMMVEYLLKLVSSSATDVSADAQNSLVKLLTEDSSHAIRLRLIHGLCDLAHGHRDILCHELWRLVGSRVSAKNKQERKDAVTGLGQNYFTNYVAHHLSRVQAEGDDCSLDTLRKVLRTCAQQCNEDRFSWIPGKIFQAASFGDTIDPDMRNRVFLVMDEILLGSELPNSSKRLSATARSVGLAVLIHSLKQETASNSFSWVGDLLKQRARLQKASREYLEARCKIKAHQQGSEQAMVADAEALDKLELMACITGGQSMSVAERNPILESFHRAKDKKIFRILSTISTPTHCNTSRIVAFDEMPKKVKIMGEDVVKWVKTLVRRCAMGDFVNKEVVRHCILLADECFQEEDIESSQKFLECVYLAAESFPELCSTTECFGTLIELFVNCRLVSCTKLKRLIARFGVLSTLGAILSAISPHIKPGMTDVAQSASQHLFDLCSVDGTPEQARHAVGTIVSLYGLKRRYTLSQEQNHALSDLLESLTSTSNLDDAYGSDCPRLLTILVALTELSLHASEIFNSKNGRRSIQFAVDVIIFGRSKSREFDSKDVASNANYTTSISRSKRGRKVKSQQSDAKLSSLSPIDSIIDDSCISVSCRTYCAAIQFVTSYIRADCFSRIQTSQQSPKIETLDLVEQLFNLFTRIILDQGFTELHRSKKATMGQESAALRQCASICLLRLCDPRLSLDRRHLTTERWHILAGIYLDDERDVREAVMTELSLMLTGNGSFGKFKEQGAMVPLLRLVAFAALCVDGDNGLNNAAANGNAANVGKKTLNIRFHTRECVVALRKAYEATAAQARASGAEAENAFESHMKVALMPEFVVPYAFHLLSFRPETPFCNPSSQSNLDSDASFDESNQRILRKRLKWLFDPLVMSLGDSADNISFLLRMTEALGSYEPIIQRISDHEKRVFVYLPNVKNKELAPSKLKVVCIAAREVLLSYVKKDVNLAVYPGNITLPAHLFQRRRKHHSSLVTTSNFQAQSLDFGAEKDVLRLSSGPSVSQASRGSDCESIQSSDAHDNQHSPKRGAAPQLDLRITRRSCFDRKDSPTIQAGSTNDTDMDSNKSDVNDLSAVERIEEESTAQRGGQFGKRSRPTEIPKESKRPKDPIPLRPQKYSRILKRNAKTMPDINIKGDQISTNTTRSVDGKENTTHSEKVGIRRSLRHLAK